MVSDDDRTAVVPLGPGEEEEGDRTVVAGGEPEDDLTMVAGGDSEAGAEDLTMVRPAPPERPRLVSRDATGALHELPIAKPDVLVGRGAGCDVALTNPEVSRQHVRIVTRGRDRVLVNVGTRGNTYVNGQAVTGEQVLKHGDVILLASEQLVYASLDDTPPLGTPGTPGMTAAAAAVATAPGAVPSGATAPRSRTALVGLALGFAGLAFAGLYVLLQEPEPPAPAAVASVPAAAPPAPRAPEPPPEPAPAPPAVAAAPPAPRPDPAESRAEQVRKLVYRADVAYLEKRYLTPPDDSAVYLYAEALKIEPDNARAREQIAAIVDTYVRWAEEALARRDRSRAAQMVDKASYVIQQASAAGEPPDVRRRLDAVKSGLAGR